MNKKLTLNIIYKNSNAYYILKTLIKALEEMNSDAEIDSIWFEDNNKEK